jgi:superfamily I DNA and/or RNA helicase
MGEYSPSLMNVAEARSVVYFVKKVLDEGKTQEDIGVVTPYRRQVSISPTPYTQLFTAKVR